MSEAARDTAAGEVDSQTDDSKADGATVTPDVSGTVFADPEDFTIKHPLEREWTLWFDNPGKKASKETWGESLKPLSTFGTVEDFWSVFNNVRPASALSPGSNYHLFLNGVRPEWEDAANSGGGKWVVTFKRDQKQTLDRLWMYLLLAVIGEQFDDGEHICGVVVNIRTQQSRIGMWVRDGSNKKAFMSLGEQIKEILGLGPKKLEFTTHSAAMRKSSSRSAASVLI